MLFYLTGFLVSIAILSASLLFLHIGHRLGARDSIRDREAPKSGTGPIEGAVFGLLGLMLAFVFGSAASRFETRRQLLVNEANAIGTAWLRIDVLSPADQPGVRDLMRRYTDARIALLDRADDESANAAADAAQQALWSAASTSVRSPGALPAAGQLLLPALNESFDLASTRAEAQKTHVPVAVVGVLVCMVLLASLLAGYASAARRFKSRLHSWVFALAVSGALYLIIDLEFPRYGMIRVSATDHLLRDARAAMK